MDSPNPEVSLNCKQQQRSLPIPKQINLFILANYGENYYSSTSSQERQEILKQIENQCFQSGFKHIRAQEIERRLFYHFVVMVSNDSDFACIFKG